MWKVQQERIVADSSGHPESTNVANELDEMVTRYDKRKRRGLSAWKHQYYERARQERDVVFAKWLTDRFPDRGKLRCLEVGAGSGKNIPSLQRFGIPLQQITANELLVDRLSELTEEHPEVQTIAGNAMDISAGPYDVILVSTVFTSILDESFRKQLASHLIGLLADEGCVLWYDFSYQNPLNKDVSGITIAQLRELFAEREVLAERITLTPPVALLVGPFYKCLAWIPFLKSHVAAIVS